MVKIILHSYFFVKQWAYREFLSLDVCGNQLVESPNYCDELNPCSNGANCSEAGDSYFCDCATCWTGKNCTEFLAECSTPSSNPVPLSCHPNPCSNGGSCSELNGSYSCDCPKCLTGSDCTEKANECTEIPCTAVCLNGGTCLLAESSESICNCVFGFTGSMCETNLVSCSVNYCKNGGACFLVESQSVCLCQPQFTGSRCATRLCEAEEDVPV